MKSALLIPSACLAAAIAIVLGQDTPSKFAVSQENIAKIDAALPEKTPAPVGRKHEILVFTRTEGFRHSSIPVGLEAMKRLGGKTGLFQVTHTEDPAAFEKESLSKFDAVLMLNTTGDVFRSAGPEKEEVYKRNLVEFVKSGKGLIGIHSATDTYRDWREYNDMMGGAFVSHPWGAGDTVRVRNLETGHPVNAPFDGNGFTIRDEIYKFRSDTASPSERRMLLALDPDGTDMQKDREDKRELYPIAWVDKYGEGRVFYCSLGHNDEVYMNPPVVAHYLAGIQFALGELTADATPRSIARINSDGEWTIVAR